MNVENKRKQDEFTENAKQLLKTLMEIVQDKKNDHMEAPKSVKAFCKNNTISFHRFLGFLAVELQNPSVPKSVAIDILIEVSVAGFHIGENDIWDRLGRVA